MPHYELLLKSEFSAAHQLHLPNGELEPLHGHNWEVEVTVSGHELDSSGMLADFTQLQPKLQEVTGRLHDTCLNQLPAFGAESPSTERVARWIHDRLEPQIPAHVRIMRVLVWETRTCAAAYVPTP